MLKVVDQRSPLSLLRPLILKGVDQRSPLSLVRPLILKMVDQQSFIACATTFLKVAEQHGSLSFVRPHYDNTTLILYFQTI